MDGHLQHEARAPDVQRGTEEPLGSDHTEDATTLG